MLFRSISDGLFADLAHILKASGVGARVQQARIPLSEAAKRFLSDKPELLPTVYNRGDDYELCFTAAPGNRDSIRQLLSTGARVGVIESGSELLCVRDDGRVYRPEMQGYDHFPDRQE